MENSNWERFKWLWKSFLELRKKSYPLAILGTRLVISSLASVPFANLAIHLLIPDGFIIQEIQLSANDLSIYSLIIGSTVLIIGGCLIYIDINKLHNQARKTAKVFITGMLGTSKRFPTELLSHSEKTDARESIELSIPESDDYSLSKQIEIYNAELIIQLYERFILHHDCDKIYLGGLARIPFLVAYGACFRAVSAKIKYFDRFHRNGEWALLNDEDKNITLSTFDINNVIVGENGDIGLAVCFSTSIQKEHLPLFIRENITFLTPSTTSERNLVNNQDNIHRISGKIQQIIDDLSNKKNCKKIHLFLSVQSTLALDIGKRYQEGIHKNWVIHNFDASLGEYNWAIELSKNGISKYQN